MHFWQSLPPHPEVVQAQTWLAWAQSPIGQPGKSYDYFGNRLITTAGVGSVTRSPAFISAGAFPATLGAPW
jgi:hypothetical protein